MKLYILASLFILAVSVGADDVTRPNSILSDPSTSGPDLELQQIIGRLVESAVSSTIEPSTNAPSIPDDSYADPFAFLYSNEVLELLGRRPTLFEMIPSGANDHSPVVGPTRQIFTNLRLWPTGYVTPGNRPLAHEPDFYQESVELEEARRRNLPFAGSKEDLARFRSLAKKIRDKWEANQLQTQSKDAEPKDDDQCPICLDSLGPIDRMRLACNHELHTSCLQILVEKNIRKCPICRNRFSLRDLIDANSQVTETTTTLIL